MARSRVSNPLSRNDVQQRIPPLKATLPDSIEAVFGFAEKQLKPTLGPDGFASFARAHLVNAKTADWDSISNTPGAYWIFSDLDLAAYRKFSEAPCEVLVELDEGGATPLKLRCLYNGKANEVRSRLKNHLLSENLFQRTVSLRLETNAISSLSEEELEKVKAAKGDIKIERDIFYRNGIDCRTYDESNWYFLVLPCKHGFQALVEELWRQYHGGKPPLCAK